MAPGGFAPGSRIAGYLLEEQIGQGGMAVVFRAHDERLDRTVALKILAPALAADEAFRQRFIRESRAAAAVDDPHIIPVFEAGEASGVLFIAMRFVRGGDVKSLVGLGGPMPPGRAAEIISQAASALDAAHGRGLVHRDVKPANMLLDATSGGGRPDHVYLSDFGLSKGSLQTSGLTGTGTFLGTLDYISPEQIEGKPVDGRADEYALACAAFELLTGSPPFQRDEAMAVMYAQLSEPPPPLTSRRRLPYAVNDVFFKALAKAPAGRYASCREFSDALRAALGFRPYDSGETEVPGDEHPATRLVGPEPGTAQRAGTPGGRPGPGGGAEGDYAGQGAGAGGYQGPTRYPGPGYAGQVPGSAGQGGQASQGGYRGQPGYQGQGGYQGQPGYQGQAGNQGQGGYGAPSRPGVGGPAVQGPGPGPGAGPGDQPDGAGGRDFGEAETQLAGSGRRTSPDLTAQQWQQQGPPGGYGGQASLARPWWKSPLALVAAVVVLLGGGAAAYALTRNTGGGNGGGGPSSGHSAVGLKPPACGKAVASGTKVHHASTYFPTASGTGQPFGIQVSKDGRALFVVTDSFLDVYKLGSDGKPTGTPFQYTLPIVPKGEATTAVLTSDGKHLLVAAGNGIDVVDADAAEAGASSIFVGGPLIVPGAPKYGRAINVAVTPNGQFAFVSLGFADQVGVFNLGSSAYLGSINVGTHPVGLTVSPDGATLYATSWIEASTPIRGQLAVIDVAKATSKSQMSSSVIRTVTTGCWPARIAVTRDNETVWVTTEHSNFLLGYSASLLRSKKNALIAKVHVGKNPIGVALVKGGSRIIVADSGSTAGPPNDLAVIDPSAALARKHALLGLIPSHEFPHEIAVAPNGAVLYVTNRNSYQIQAVDLGKIP